MIINEYNNKYTKVFGIGLFILTFLILLLAGNVAGAAQETKLTANDGTISDSFGISVSVNGDTAVIGAFGKDGYKGSTYVFTRNGTTWTQQTKLNANDGAAYDSFGYSVSVNGDTAVIGAYGKDGYKGSAYVFTRSGTTWTQQTKLNANDGTESDSFGISVSVNGDTAVIGAYGKDGYKGSAYVFTRSGTTWTQQTKLNANDGAAYDTFGYSVSVNGDTAVIGAYGKDGFKGSAYVFTRSGTTWTQQTKLNANDGAASDRFGYSVSLDGDTAVIGAYGKDGYKGLAYVFTRSGTTWTQQTKLNASDGAAYDAFGHSVSVKGDTAVIGAYIKDGFKGLAYVFNRSGTTWTQQTKLNASDGAAPDHFGYSVSVNDNSAFIGAYKNNHGKGSAYVFSLQGAVTGDAPVITNFVPVSPVSGIFGTPRTFNITVNQKVNVTWYINGTKVQINESTSEAKFTNTNASIGTWNVSAFASNTNGSAMQTWLWTVITTSFISFTDPTPANGTTLTQNHTHINTTVSDASTAFIDWNSSLTGWLRFNGESNENSTFFRDWSNSGNNGTCFGATCPVLTSGKFGSALSFDGVNDYVSMGSIASTASGTMEAWIKPGGNYSGYQIVMSGLNSSGSDKSSRYTIFARWNSEEWGTIIGDNISNQSAYSGQKYDSTNFTAGIWTHLVITYNGTNISFYKDGIIINSIPQTVNGTGDAQPYSIGRSGGKDIFYFNGMIDEPRIHTRALSPEEVKASYNASINRLYQNFTNLANGIYNYRAYAQDQLGNVNQTETRTVTVNSAPVLVAPVITYFAPVSPVSDIIGTPRTFNITVGQTVNVTWYINGTQVQLNESVLQAKYINASAAVGTWNISAFASNTNGSAIQTWLWTVSTTEPLLQEPFLSSNFFESGILKFLNIVSDIIK